MIRDLKGTVEDRIPVRTALVSVFDKSGLDTFIPELVHACPDIQILSTGGTYKKIQELLGADAQRYLLSVEQYTGAPEMEGGLVKTLHPKIHAGILGERGNPEHRKYIEEIMKGKYIEMVVVNLYPFHQVVSSPDVTLEKARGNIDIGGPTMLRAASKNFPNCAAVCDHNDYEMIIKGIKETGGCTTFDMRFWLARKVFRATKDYETAIEDFLSVTEFRKARECYGLPIN